MKIIYSVLQSQSIFMFLTFVLFLHAKCSISAEINHANIRHQNHMKIHKKTMHYLNKKDGDEINNQFKRTLPPNIWMLLAENSIKNHNESNGSKYNENDQVNRNEIDNDDLDFEPQINDHDSSSNNNKNSLKCPKCTKNSVKMSEDELTNLRIEYVKNQILHKLRLNERPPKKIIDDLPEPIQEGYAIQNDESSEYLNRQLDDYFAKTTQKIIFLTQAFENCQNHDYPSVCFDFQISSDLDVSTVESAHLWIYKEPNNLDQGMNHTFLLSEVGFWGTSKKFIKSKTLAISEVEQDNKGWEKIDIAWPFKTWVEYHEIQHTIQLACETCSSKTLPISMHPDHKPFIVINTYPKRSLNRQRRSVNCNPTSTECCRDSLYIDFTTIGWNDWIIHPKGYNAYFCRGFCNRVASITQAGAHHSTIFNKFLHNTSKNNKKKLELIPCCTATSYSSLQIFYLDSNNTATQATLPNMIVESCGCS